MNFKTREIVCDLDKISFEEKAMEIFVWQSEKNEVYRKFLSCLNRKANEIKWVEEIPFLPIEFFKTQKVYCGEGQEQQVFTSSGTSGSLNSKHYVKDLAWYEQSFIQAFEREYGHPSAYCILALLPSYLERTGSSLVYMTNWLVQSSGHPQSGFFLHNIEELIKTIDELKQSNSKCLLLGVSYALLDLAEKGCRLNEQFIVMETGGMKGKRKEMVKEELHQVLCEKLGVNEIHSEYGMTELLSQAYSKGMGLFTTPPWMNILIRDMNDPFQLLPQGKTGGINVIDLANVYSCSFIATQDIGRITHTRQVEVLGRFDNSDIRGCNLMIE